MGTVVGAGFASGQEVLRFFTAFGPRGTLGVALASALLAAAGVAVLRAAHAWRARSHRELLLALGGRWLGGAADAVVTAFLLAGCAVMFAGSGAIAAEQFGLPEAAGRWGMALATTATVLLGLRGVVRATSLVAPALAAAVVALSLWSLAQEGAPGAGGVRPAAGTWWLAAVLYASYNLVLALAVLAPLGSELPRDEVRVLGGAAGGAALGLTACLIHTALLAHLGRVAAAEVPMLELARSASPVAAAGYAGVLWAEVYTTAVASLFGVVRRLFPSGGRRYAAGTLLLAAAALGLGRLGFSRLVATVYPAVGYLGLALLAAGLARRRR